MDTQARRGESLVLVDNTDRDRFELWDGQTILGMVAYQRDGEVDTLLHTVVEEDYGHQGVARLLVSLVMTRLRLDDRRFVPVCTYITRFLGRFPQYKDLVAKGW